MTILDITLSNPDLNADGAGDFDILAAALGLFPGLVDAAGNPDAELTVFAPTDQAFLNLANLLDPSVGTDEDAAVNTLVAVSGLLSPSTDATSFLNTVLTYHIAGEALTGAQVASAHEIETLAGAQIRSSVTTDGLVLRDLDPDITNPFVTNPAGSENGIVADNGIIHVIDNVLLPADITFAPGGAVSTGKGSDIVVGTDGSDEITAGADADIVNGAGGDDEIRGGKGSDLAIGGAGDDLLAGGRGSDALEGGTGADDLFGARGNDTMDGGAGDDFLSGARGRDVLSGDAGDDEMRGGKGSDDLDGGTGADTLDGGRGSDTLTGAEGDDVLTGGRGGDSFVFNPFRADEGNDIVTDFNPGNDKLVLDLSTGDADVLAAIAAEGDPGLQFTDLLTFDTDPDTAGVQAAVTLGASADGDLLITHPTGTIELDGIPSTVDPAALLPAIEFDFG